jgi:hypothetical protein
MEMWRKLSNNRIFMVGLLVPLVFQIIYLCIAIPAIKDGNARITDLKIAIVNEDASVGKEVAAKLVQVLPFKTEQTTDLAKSLEAMNAGDLNMVIHIAPDFTAKLQQGGAQVAYYINQSAPGMTKQTMERTALSINQTINENAFNNAREAIRQNASKGLSQTGLPANALVQINDSLNQAFDSLKYTIIRSEINKTNNADGFAQSVTPFFIFLTYFIGCVVMTFLHSLAYKSLNGDFPRRRMLLFQLGVSIAISLIIPGIAIGLMAGFGIPFSLGVGAVWLLLSISFLTLLYLVQMFGNWFGVAGIGIGVVLLFPLQLVTSGLIYSKEILPAFYTGISACLPANYLGDGMLKAFYGGPSIAKDAGILALMVVIFIIISALTVLKGKKVAV